MMRYRNKLVYDANTGEIRDDKILCQCWRISGCQEERAAGETSTLPGGQNLGEITDMNTLKKKLPQVLNVPSSRMDGEGGFNLGRSSEILRDGQV